MPTIQRKRVLIIRFSSLGDVVLTLPAIDALNCENYEIHYLTKATFKPILEAHGGAQIIHTISDHAKLRELLIKIRELRHLQFDLVYDLHRNIRSRVVKEGLRRPFRTVRKFRLAEMILFVVRWRMFRTLGFRPLDRAQANLRVIAKDETVSVSSNGFRKVPTRPTELLGFLKERNLDRYVCFAAESAWRQKEWPVERFYEVADFVAKKGLGIIWLGLRKLEKASCGPGELNLTAKLELSQVISILAGAAAIVCNDSGLMHLAEAEGIPAVAVFGPTTRELGFGTRLSSSTIIDVPLWCRPCSKTGRWCLRLWDRRRCLRDVKVTDVVAALDRVLQNDGRSPETFVSMQGEESQPCGDMERISENIEDGEIVR